MSQKPTDLRLRLMLHVLTDRELSRGRSVLAVVEAALNGGATIIQLRDKTSSTRELIEDGLALRELTRRRDALLIVNDRIDVALAIKADGVHIGQDDMPARIARQMIGSKRILGVSVSTAQEAQDAIADGADYLGIGPIYTTRSKLDAGRPVGLHLLRELSHSHSIPLVAIGGINRANTYEIIQAGATGIAVISAVVGADDITKATRDLMRAITG